VSNSEQVHNVNEKVYDLIVLSASTGCKFTETNSPVTRLDWNNIRFQALHHRWMALLYDLLVNFGESQPSPSSDSHQPIAQWIQVGRSYFQGFLESTPAT
jgi:hypothetical protein